MPAVLHVAQPTGGGVAGYVVAAAADQLARGWRVAVACPPGRLADELAARAVPWYRWDAVRSPGRSVRRESAALRGLVGAFGPDVVHLHSAKAGEAGRLAVRGRVPTLFQPHGWSWLAATGALRMAALAWERAAVRWTDLFVCVGRDEAELAAARRLRGRYSVVRNGIDLTRFTPGDRSAARAALGLDPAVPLAVCVGRVTPQKGQDRLVAAWPAVRRRCPGALLRLVGAVDPGRLLAGAPGIAYAGPARDVRTWYRAADVVVLPSRWEGLPLTVLEALACGRPVVGCDVPGLREVVGPGVGILVPPNDLAALAGATADRLTDSDLAAAEGRAAACHAHRYDLRVTLDRLAAVTVRIA
jgi:glycosyltransferase involved in cell wall biosynthesis